MDPIDYVNGRDTEELQNFEVQSLSDLRDQISNAFGDMTGEEATQIDLIRAYIEKVTATDFNFGHVEDFENVAKTLNREEEYDTFASGLLSIFTEFIGISFDLDRGNTYFKDLYDVYSLLVLNLKQSIKESTKGYYGSIGKNITKYDASTVSEYCLGDEFCANDDFIQNMAHTHEEAVVNILDKINDFELSIDHDTFSDYVYKFVIENMAS